MKTVCGRCKTELARIDAETCWWCVGDLCQRCWDKFGECGHLELDEARRKVLSGRGPKKQEEPS